MQEAVDVTAEIGLDEAPQMTASENLLESVGFALNSTLQLAEVLRKLAGITLEAVGAGRCSIFLLEGNLLRPAAAIGDLPDDELWAAFRAMGPIDLDQIPFGWDLLGAGRAIAVRDAGSSPLVPSQWADRFEVKSLVLVPLMVAGTPCGVMAVDHQTARAYSSRELRLLEAVGSYAGVAVRNAQLFESRGAMVDQLSKQLRRMEILHALGETLAGQADAETLKRKLNELLSDEGIGVEGLAFRDRKLALRLGGDPPVRQERGAWQAKRSIASLEGEVISVAMHLGRRIVGGLRVRPAAGDPAELAFLETLSHGVAEVASRSALRATVEEAERERLIAAERGRIAGDLHDTAGQLFVAIGLLARRESQLVPADSPWHAKLARLAELADAGKWEISRAIQALAFFPEARRGIVASLRAFARSFGKDSGIETLFEVSGSPPRLSPKLERGLYRIAHEALSNAWRHAGCTTVRITLVFEPQHVALRVADDGRGIRRSLATTGMGIAGMRRAVDELGGTLKIASTKPHGTLVEVHVPRDPR